MQEAHGLAEGQEARQEPPASWALHGALRSAPYVAVAGWLNGLGREELQRRGPHAPPLGREAEAWIHHGLDRLKRHGIHGTPTGLGAKLPI